MIDCVCCFWDYAHPCHWGTTHFMPDIQLMLRMILLATYCMGTFGSLVPLHDNVFFPYGYCVNLGKLLFCVFTLGQNRPCFDFYLCCCLRNVACSSLRACRQCWRSTDSYTNSSIDIGAHNFNLQKNAVPRIIVDVGILQYNKPFQIILIFGDLVKQS